MNMANGERISCAECSAKVGDEERLVHVYERHLCKQLFICPGCDYFSTHDKLDVERHIARQHTLLSKVGVVSHVHFYDDEIREWTNRCWPNCVEYIQTTDVCELDCSKDEVVDVEKMEADENSEEEGDDMAETAPDQLGYCESDEALGSYCRVCETFVAGMREDHVYQTHLNKALSQCPLCDFSCTHSQQTVHDHIAQSHKDSHPPPSPITLEDSLRDEIAEWNRQCWDEDHSDLASPPLKYFDDEDKENCRAIDQLLRLDPEEECDISMMSEDPIDVSKTEEEESCYCAECSSPFNESKMVHIYRIHVKQQLFLCPDCPFSSMHDLPHVAAHLLKVHGIDDHHRVVSRIALFREKIAEWESQCFDRRQVDDRNRAAPNPLRRHSKRVAKPPIRATMKGSKSSQNLACDLCRTPVRHFEMRMHVFKKHLRVGDLFCCSECGFASDCDKRLVERHALKEHPLLPNRRVITRLSEFKTELADLERQCWPKSKRSRQNEHQWLTCALCHDVIKSLDRRRHVLRDHLRVPDMYSCLHCDFVSSYLRDSVVRHSNSLHADPNIQNRLDEMRERLDDLTMRCFPLRDKAEGRVGQWAVVYAKPVHSSKDGGGTYCLICRKSFGENAGNHVRRHHMPMLYHSAVCAYSAVDSRSVECHLRSHHPQIHCASSVVNKSAFYADEMVKAYKNCFKQAPSLRAVNRKTKNGVASAPCRLCKVSVASDVQLKHIYKHHLVVGDMFKCSACDFESGFDERLVSEHVMQVHGDADLAISKTGDSVEKVNAFMTACFDANADSLSKQCATAFDIKRFCSKKMAVCKQCDNSQSIARHRMKEHIWKIHMPHLPFKCPFCEEHRFRPCDVKDHVRRYHRKQKRADVVNKTYELKELFFDQFKRCFC